MTTRARRSPSGRSVRTPVTVPSGGAEQTDDRRRRERAGRRRPRPCRPASGRSRGGTPSPRCTAADPTPRCGSRSVSAWVVGQHHRRAAGDPALDRRLLPPLRVQAVEDARVDDAAVHVLAAGERPPLEQQDGAAGPGQHRGRARPGRAGADDDDVEVGVSHAVDSRQCRAAGQLVEHGVGVGDDGQVGHLHHRAVRVGVDADDVGGRAEPGRVLDGAADAEGEVQVGVDDDAGRADLALVADPAAVGDDAGGAHRRAEARRRRRRAGAKRAAPSSPAPPPTIRRASARSIVVTSGGSTSTTVGVVAVTVAGAGVDRSVRSAAAGTPGVTPADPGLERRRRRARGRRPRGGRDRRRGPGAPGRARSRRPRRAGGRPRTWASRGARSRPSGEPGSTTTSSSTSGASARDQRSGAKSPSSTRRTSVAMPPSADAVGADPASTARPPHSAITSSAPAGSTPSRTGTTASIRSG